MKILDFNFFDEERSREVPATLYLPENFNRKLSVVVFNPGYRSQKELANKNRKPPHKNYSYLGNYFTDRDMAFITVGHDILGDKDSLETIDLSLIQHEARRYLYERGVANISFALESISRQIEMNLDRFIIGGHSNGGDISKYFVTLHPERASHLILFDSLRCRIEPKSQINLLIFEADDTSMDSSIFPEPKSRMRSNLEWILIKPRGAVHISYTDENITEDLKSKIFKALNLFLSSMAKSS